MNVIVSNKYQALLSNLNVDVIKNINGVFSVDSLANQFKNFFYNKLILDITALENYEDINTIQRLSIKFDMNKVILLLDDSIIVNSASYLSSLVSMGVYNFTKNIDSVEFLIDNPNTYKDVVGYHQLNNIDIENPDNKKDNKDVYLGQRIIGLVNVTENAGSSTLSYLLKKHLEKLYKVVAVEINKHDYEYFNDKDLVSIGEFELKNYISNHSEYEVILVDANSNEAAEYCSEVLYLVEPGLIPLNKAVQNNNYVFKNLKGQKIVLNKSVLSAKDVSDFERESGTKVFYNIPYVDDKSNDIKEINEFLLALGFTRFNNGKKSSGFNLFK